MDGPTLRHFNCDRWSALLRRLGLNVDAASEFDRLQRAYGERHRAYHTAVHIDDCLDHLDDARAECDEPDEVEFALWLHDAVYRTRGAGSEEESARWAAELLHRGNATDARTSRVEQLILATQHAASVPRGDAAIVVDIDLSILGREAQRFDRYEDEVRREYRWVPAPLFRSKRAELLESFLARPQIYATPRFHTALEAPARGNLSRSLVRLRGAS